MPADHASAILPVLLERNLLGNLQVVLCSWPRREACGAGSLRSRSCRRTWTHVICWLYW